MTEAEEDKLLALKDFMMKSNKAKANIGDQSHLSDNTQSGIIDLGTLGITGRQVDLVKARLESEDKRGVYSASDVTAVYSFNRMSICWCKITFRLMSVLFKIQGNFLK